MVHSEGAGEGAVTPDHPVLMAPCWIHPPTRYQLYAGRGRLVEASVQVVVPCACVYVSERRTRLTARHARCVQCLTCGCVLGRERNTPRFGEFSSWKSHVRYFSQYLRAAVPWERWAATFLLRWSRLPGRNMEDLPAVEPVKIYENTYRLEPADNEK